MPEEEGPSNYETVCTEWHRKQMSTRRSLRGKFKGPAVTVQPWIYSSLDTHILASLQGLFPLQLQYYSRLREESLLSTLPTPNEECADLLISHCSLLHLLFLHLEDSFQIFTMISASVSPPQQGLPDHQLKRMQHPTTSPWFPSQLFYGKSYPTAGRKNRYNMRYKKYFKLPIHLLVLELKSKIGSIPSPL